QMIDVRVCTNAPSMKLFLNDKLIGEATINHKKDKDIIKSWKIPFTKGELIAKAYNDKGEIIAKSSRKSFGDAFELKIKENKNILLANGEDLVYLDITSFDKDGNTVENANNRIHVKVSGKGKLLGLDNGDSTDIDQYKGTTKRLFSGKCSAVIGSTLEAGEIKIEVKARGLKPARIVLTSIESKLRGEAKKAKLANNAMVNMSDS